jgi:Trypsin-like peptidase domain
MNWNLVVDKVSPYIFKINTPSGSGTGFLCLYSGDKNFCGIATALHVVEHEDEWRQPIKIEHHESGQTLFSKESERVIFANRKTDSAVILVKKPDFPLPEKLIPLLPVSSPLHIGNEVGWLGFPAIDSNTLCFFSGNISAIKQSSYLIDGVAIHGVSGGPVIYSSGSGPQIVGIVSAYRANRATGETLPGLLFAQDVSHFHGVVDRIRSIEEAKTKKEEEEARKKKEEAEKAQTAPQPDPNLIPAPSVEGTPVEKPTSETA